MYRLVQLVSFIVVFQMIGLLALPFSLVPSVTWWTTLHKPFFLPVGVFTPIRTLSFLLMGISFFLLWGKERCARVKKTINIFLIQVLVNSLWIVLFFGLHSPLLGLVDIMLLLVFVAMTIYLLFPISRAASLLLVPYLGWVGFVAVLNVSILALNH